MDAKFVIASANKCVNFFLTGLLSTPTGDVNAELWKVNSVFFSLLLILGRLSPLTHRCWMQDAIVLLSYMFRLEVCTGRFFRPGPGLVRTHFFFAGPARRKNPLSFACPVQPVRKTTCRLPARSVGKVISHLPARTGPGTGLASDSGQCKPLKRPFVS